MKIKKRHEILVSAFLLGAMAATQGSAMASSIQVSSDHEQSDRLADRDLVPIRMLVKNWEEFGSVVEQNYLPIPDTQVELAAQVAALSKGIYESYQANDYSKAALLHHELSSFLSAHKAALIDGFETRSEAQEVVAMNAIGNNGEPQTDNPMLVFVAAEIIINM
jgi:hypothetical protein